MKSSLLALSAGLILFCAGCQSMNWMAKNKPAKENTVAQNTPVREVPWTWGKKKEKSPASEMPPDFAAKFEKSKEKSAAPKSASEWVLEGNQAEVARNFPEARRAYESALSVDPVDPDAHHRLGILADMRQDYAAAQDHYQAALRQKPHDANLLSDFGYSHQLRGQPNQSERYLLMALDLDGQHKQALKNLGSLYASQNRPQDALQAFRRFRPEAEAQQLLSQYFPDAASDSAPGTSPFLAAHNDLSQDDISPQALERMSRDQILAVMEQQRQASIRAREQKELAELRPNLQDSMTEADYARSQSPRSDDWTREPSAPAGNNFARSVPPNLESTANRTPVGVNAARPANGFPESNSAAQDQQFWNGKPLQARHAVQPQQPGLGFDQPGCFTGRESAANQSLNRASTPPPSWATEPAANSGAGPSVSAGYDPSQDRASGSANAAWNPSPLASAPHNPSSQTNPGEMSSRQRAYQLGMNAGPGMMFPVLPNDAAASLAAPANQLTGPSWGTNTANAYQETRATSGWESPANSPNAGQWRDAVTDVAPRSPTESWGPPASAPWPGNQTAGQSTRGTAQMPPTESRMPVINPGPSRNVNADGSSSQGAVPAGNTESHDQRLRNGSDVVPAWYDRPAAQPRSNGATSVEKWPYAPR